MLFPFCEESTQRGTLRLEAALNTVSLIIAQKTKLAFIRRGIRFSKKWRPVLSIL